MSFYSFIGLKIQNSAQFLIFSAILLVFLIKHYQTNYDSQKCDVFSPKYIDFINLFMSQILRESTEYYIINVD